MASGKQVATSQPRKEVVSAAAIDGNVEHFSPGKQHGLVSHFAAKFGVDSDKMLETLKQTAFRQRGKSGQAAVPVTNEQMMMLLVVAKEYNLNPFTREIYAFPSEGGITPIVSVDGWIRIINERPELEYLEIEIAPSGTDDPWCSCEIKRRDRTRPTKITEFLEECSRDTDPWNDMPRRMLRHKALIQCARVAFGFAGIFDPDEGDKIVSIIEQGTLTKKPATAEPQRKVIAQDQARTPPPDDLPRVTLDQATVLADKIKEEGIPLTELLAIYQIGSLEELPAHLFADAKGKIDELSKNA